MLLTYGAVQVKVCRDCFVLSEVMLTLVLSIITFMLRLYIFAINDSQGGLPL